MRRPLPRVLAFARRRARHVDCRHAPEAACASGEGAPRDEEQGMDGVIRTFDRIEDAEAARRALLDAGFARERIELSSREDEAGPQEGNFIAGNGRVDAGRPGEYPVAHSVEDAYDANYQPVERRSAQMLVVAVADADERRRAESALARWPAVEP
jgi:hypothetical protein